MEYKYKNGKPLNIDTFNDEKIKDFFDHIYEAHKLALKNQIKANSVIIDKNFAIMNGFYFCGRAFTPTIFGLKVDYANLNTKEIPFDTAFILTNHEVAPTKYEKYEQVINIINEHKLLNYVLENENFAKAYHLSDEEIEILKRGIN